MDVTSRVFYAIFPYYNCEELWKAKQNYRVVESHHFPKKMLSISLYHSCSEAPLFLFRENHLPLYWLSYLSFFFHSTTLCQVFVQFRNKRLEILMFSSNHLGYWSIPSWSSRHACNHILSFLHFLFKSLFLSSHQASVSTSAISR